MVHVAPAALKEEHDLADTNKAPGGFENRARTGGRERGAERTKEVETTTTDNKSMISDTS